MSYDSRKGSGRSGDAAGSSSSGTPGKRTLTQGVRAVQEKREGEAAPAAEGDGGGGGGGGGGGQAMPAGTQAKMEQSFGVDFSAVRVHEGEAAARPGALAYTQGTDVHFAPGQYDPHGQAGQELLGHELTHVVQQSQGRVQANTQAKGVGLNDDAALEHEADVHGAAAARGEPVSTGAAAVSIGGGGAPAVQCFVPTDPEQVRATAAFDTLLGAAVDPGGLRAAATTAAASIGALEAAVDAIVNGIAVPLGARAPLIARLGNDCALTAALLNAANAASEAGTPAVRLNRVLDENPGVARTVLDLQPLLTAQLSIDDKILRGRQGGAIGANQKPSTADRTLIGGHSPEMFDDDAYTIDADATNANLTHSVTFRKLLRSDGGASATAVVNAAADDPVGGCEAMALTAHGAANAAVAPVNAVPADLADRNPVAFGKATAQFNARLAAFNAGVAAVNLAHGASVGHAAAVRLVAAAAAAAPTSGDAVKPFTDSMINLFNGLEGLVRSTTVVDPAAGAIAKAAFDAIRSAFETRGPVMSVPKASTIAPDGMTDDEVLQAGDRTAAVPATLIRVGDTNVPTDGGQVATKHQLVINNMVWVAMKEGVTFTRGVPDTLTGGRVTSSFPTSATVIAPDAVHPLMDGDRFSTIPPP